MTTEPSREELLDLALGLLEPAEARALEAHAEGCAACRAELASLRQARQLVAGLPPLPAPERGAAVLLAAARQAAGARRSRWAMPRWLAGGALGLAGATALALLVLRGPAVPTRGPLSEDREALLGQAAPASAPAKAPAVVAAQVVAVEEAKAGSLAQAEPRRAAPAEKRVEVRDDLRDELREAPADQAAPARKAEAGIGGAGAGRLASPRPAPGSPPPAADLPTSTSTSTETATASSAPPPSKTSAAAREAPAALRARSAASARGEASLAAAANGRSDEAAAPCRLEQRRRLVRDDAGSLVGRVREGRYPDAGGEVALRVEERFGADGRLLGATVRAGARIITVSDGDVAAGRLEPLPGLLLAPTAEAAERTPPRCEP
jgi:anti-sigma factor RsiW